jgi:hypothetical protein
MVMAETAIAVLTRWEEHGAIWRVRSLSQREAVVDLCTCYGEAVDVSSPAEYWTTYAG